MTTTPPRTALPAALFASAAALYALGEHLPPLPIRQPWTLLGWLATHDPAVVAMALLHGAATIACLYLAVLCVVHLVARRSGRPTLTRWADRITASALRPLLRASLGVTLLGAPALTDPGAHVGSAAMRPDRSVALMVPRAPTPQPVLTAPSPWQRTPAPIVTPEPGAPGRGQWPTTWTVSSGESFWSIAAELVEHRAGRPRPDPDAVAPLWRALVGANRDRLVDPDDPDLLLPGQVIEVPNPAI